MTREEFITFGTRLVGAEGEPGYTTGFADDAQIADWAREAVGTAVANRILRGFEDNTLRPKSTVTQAEVITILSRLYEMKLGTTLDPPEGNLKSIPDWAASSVTFAARAGMMAGDKGVDEALTRAEIVRMSMQFFEKYFTEYQGKGSF
jgi:hypothetical protein